jgi:predicted dehydrogenase
VTIGVAVVGYGYWGPNLLRNFMEVPGATVPFVVDQSAERLALATARYTAVRATTDLDEAINDPAVDALAIATPVPSHYAIALKALQAGKHVLVEKPLAATTDECLRLIEEAEKRSLVLLVDHTFVYTPAVRKIQDLVDSDMLGELYYYDSVRINLGLVQRDLNVIWDLAVHDLSILQAVVPESPVAVRTVAGAHIPGQPENMAYIILMYDGSFIAHIHVNWLAPAKVRRTLLCGSKRMIVYDDLEPSEKLKVYDRGIEVADDPETVYDMLVSYRSGDMWSPHLELTEALHNLAHHFVRCITSAEKPITGAEAGIGIVRLLEAATRSSKNGGDLVELR